MRTHIDCSFATSVCGLVVNDLNLLALSEQVEGAVDGLGTCSANHDALAQICRGDVIEADHGGSAPIPRGRLSPLATYGYR